MARLQPSAMLVDGLGRQEALARRRAGEQQGDVVEQAGLVAFDGEQIVPTRGTDLLAQRLLTLQRIPAHQPPR